MTSLVEEVPSSAQPIDPVVADCFSTLSGHFLRDLWQKMGLEGEALKNREHTAIHILNKTLLEMRAEEESTLQKLVDRIESHAKDRNRLAKELGVHLTEPDADLGLIQLERTLRHEVKDLETQKEEHLKEVRVLRKEDEELCQKLELEPFYVSLKVIPTQAQVEGLRKHVKELKLLKDKRLAKFVETKLTIITTLEALEDEPNSTFQRQVVCEEDDSFTLSEGNLFAVEEYLQELETRVETNRVKAEKMRQRIFSLMSKLEINPEEKQLIQLNLSGHTPSIINQLDVRLRELEVLKSEKIEQFVQATRAELVSLWDLCYYSQSQRDKFFPFYSIDYTESLLEQHEKEVEAIKEYFEQNEEMFKKVAKRQELWRTMLELENKKKDPEHLLKAKGKDLLIEERDRKRVNKLLPKLTEELNEAMEDYERVNGTPFLVGGKPYREFMEEQADEFQRQQESERLSKQRQKKAVNVHETIYGSKPVTPAKRTAVKRKIGHTPMTNDTKRLRPEITFSSATLRSPRPGRNTTRTLAHNKSARYGLRPQPAKRKILGDNNTSVYITGSSGKSGRTQTGNTMCSIDSVNFLKDMPTNALTSTFQDTPESCTKRGNTRAVRTPSTAPPTFKTPTGRAPTPGNRTGRKLALSNARKMPFLI